MISDSRIDGGKCFDWGKTSADYAKYRDIYPEEFYDKIHSLGLCTSGQRVLDVGTGTGVIPRNMYRFGADFVGTDIAENQIAFAKSLSAEGGMKIAYYCSPAEKIDFPPKSFDVITACQCFFYFNHEITAPKFHDVLKKGGKLALMYKAWLPLEDTIAGESEKLILKYNSEWSGCNEKRHEIYIPDEYRNYFDVETSEMFDVKIPFTRESWNGRMKACRGVGASMTPNEVMNFEREHIDMLNTLAPEQFNILHYCAIAVLKAK